VGGHVDDGGSIGGARSSKLEQARGVINYVQTTGVEEEQKHGTQRHDCGDAGRVYRELPSRCVVR